MLLFLNEAYEAIYWRSSFANGAICVWVPANGSLKEMLQMAVNDVCRFYNAGTPEYIAYQCCPSPYSLKLISESDACEYGIAHPNPKPPPTSVLDAIREDDIEWWRHLAYASEQYARCAGSGVPRKYILNNAALRLRELWRRTLGPRNERSEGTFEGDLLKYFHNEHIVNCPKEFVEEVICRLRDAIVLVTNPKSKYDADAVTRLWELSRVSPCARLDKADKGNIQYLRNQLRNAQKRREGHRLMEPCEL